MALPYQIVGSCHTPVPAPLSENGSLLIPSQPMAGFGWVWSTNGREWRQWCCCSWQRRFTL